MTTERSARSDDVEQPFATVGDNVESAARRIEGDLELLITKFSAVDYHPQSIPGFTVISTAGDYVWRELTTEAKRLQGKVLGDYRKLCALLKVLLAQRPGQELKDFKKSEERIVETIEQDRRTHYRSTTEACRETVGMFREQRAFVGDLHSDREDVVLVPDTNALILGRAMETWRFDGIRSFELCLVPTVLEELDKLKLDRNEDVRSKAKKIIAQLKEFRRRGPLTRGVPVVNGQITLRSMAIEPDVSSSLPWLDVEHADDRFLASVVEVMRMNPRSAVVLVTHDINLQNKAEFAELPFMEPPMASAAETQSKF